MALRVQKLALTTFIWELNVVKKSIIFAIVGILLLCQLQAQAGSKRTRNAALVGGGVGLVAGGVSGAAKGATISGGAAALTSDNKGKNTKKKAKQGAAVGAGVGLLTGGVSGAAKGALYGGATGAIVGEHKDKKGK